MKFIEIWNKNTLICLIQILNNFFNLNVLFLQ